MYEVGGNNVIHMQVPEEVGATERGGRNALRPVTRPT